MFTLLIIIHILVCLAMMVAVLLQSGRAGGLGAAFGGGSQALFGGRGAAPFLSKATTVLGAGFMLSSLLLAILSGRVGRATSPESVVGAARSAGEFGAPAATEPASPGADLEGTEGTGVVPEEALPFPEPAEGGEADVGLPQQDAPPAPVERQPGAGAEGSEEVGTEGTNQ